MRYCSTVCTVACRSPRLPRSGVHDHQLGLEPAGSALAQCRNRRAVGTEPGDPLAQRLAVRRLEGEEGTAGEAQPVLVLPREQRRRRAAAPVQLGADQDEVALSPALGFAPFVDAAAAIVRVEPLRDDPF
jgi:hypothetical protein